MKPNTQPGWNPLNTAAAPATAHSCLASCRKWLARIHNVKAAILAEFRQDREDSEHLLRLALNEAEALAWETGFPQLLFPTLALEKAGAAATWHARQQRLRRRASPPTRHG